MYCAVLPLSLMIFFLSQLKLITEAQKLVLIDALVVHSLSRLSRVRLLDETMPIYLQCPKGWKPG